MKNKLYAYMEKWRRQGYPDGLPDEVLDQLMHENLAPSYKQIAIAILRNDHTLKSLGLEPTHISPWYVALKREEIAARPGSHLRRQLALF